MSDVSAINPQTGGQRRSRPWTGWPPTAERALRLICKQHGLPKPQHNASVQGFEVDAHWPAHKLIVGIDSYEFHAVLSEFLRIACNSR